MNIFVILCQELTKNTPFRSCNNLCFAFIGDMEKSTVPLSFIMASIFVSLKKNLTTRSRDQLCKRTGRLFARIRDSEQSSQSFFWRQKTTLTICKAREMSKAITILHSIWVTSFTFEPIRQC